MPLRLARNSAGSTAVEFAMALPIFLLLVLGILELGALFMSSAGLKHAVNAAARDATLSPTPTDDQIVARAVKTSFGVDRNRLLVSVNRGTHATDGDYVEVTGVYKSIPITGFTGLKGTTLTERRLVWVQKPVV